MLFLVPTHFDPLVASYLFMIFAALSIIPLYIGTKLLIDQRAAIFIVILYCLLPFYIDFTRFFWNPNFQFALTPYVIFFMGIYKKQKRPRWLFLTAFTSGALFLFHYQYTIITLGLFIYYALVQKTDRKNMVIFINGLVLGISPLLIFEIKNHFYNTQTAILFLQNFDKVFGGKKAGFSQHYLLSTSFFIWLLLLSWIQKKLKTGYLLSLFAVLFLLAVSIYGKIPSHAYGMTRDWNYLYEKKVSEIIKKENRDNYNIANLGYDNIAIVPKYLLITRGVKQNFDDYYHNQYLFVVSPRPNFMADPEMPYEVATFKPAKLLKTWKINQTYSLYLLERNPEANKKTLPY